MNLGGVVSSPSRTHIALLICLAASYYVTDAGKLSYSKKLEKEEEVILNPEILSPNDTLYLKDGSNLSISCVGDKFLTWKQDVLPAYENIDPSLLVTHTTFNKGRPFGSTFSYKGIGFDCTGRYWCLHQSNPNYNTSIYIFVFDKENLFRFNAQLNSEQPLYMKVTAHQSAKIPCRVTHPDIQVTLKKAIAKKKAIKGLTYDAKTGFTIAKVTSFFSGSFFCEAKYKTSTKTYTARQYYMLKYESHVTTEPDNPIMVASSTVVSAGQDFSITCIAYTPRLPCPTLTWSYQKSTPATRIKLTKDRCVETSRREHIYATSMLNITNAQMSDGGSYGCNATYFKWEKGSRIAITILEKSFVNIIPMRKNWVVKEGAANKILTVNIDAQPPPTITWYKDSVPINNISFPRIKQVDRETFSYIKIFTPTREDSGVYTVEGKTRSETEEKSLNLLVLYPPSAEISTTISVFFKDHSYPYHIQCDVDGEPKPNQTWSWQPCVNPGCPVNETGVWSEYNEAKQLIGENMADTMLDNTIRMKSPTQSGWLRCAAHQNSITSVDYFQVIISDLPMYLGVDLEEDMFPPIEGDRVIMKCKANIWKYSSVNIRTRNLINKKAFNSTGVLSFTNNSYSHVAVLTFDSISVNDSSTLNCMGVANNGVQRIEERTIPVQKAVAPSFLTHTEGRVSRDPGVTVAFDCNAIGLPPPKIVWYKDGVVISPQNNTNIIFAKDRKRIRIPEVNTSDAGNYLCVATNRVDRISTNISLIIGEDKIMVTQTNLGIIMGVVLGAIFTSILVILFVRHRLRVNMLKEFELLLLQPKGKIDPDLPLEEQTDAIPYDQKYEFPRDRLRMGKILGQGAFGRVVQAEAIGIVDSEEVTDVAIKMVKDCRDREQMNSLMSELKILIHVGHHVNIVNLLGAVTKNIKKGELYVIVEFCEFGSLRSHMIKYKEAFINSMDDDDAHYGTGVNNDDYLVPVVTAEQSGVEDEAETKSDTRLHQYVNKAAMNDEMTPPPLTLRNLVSYSYQVARGMEYLTMKNLVHRDLAARNVLLCRGNIVKICDFGLAKECLNDEYQKKGVGPVPVKWLAVESLTHKVYSTKSDVWSFGVFLWETFSLGGNPYPGIAIDETFIQKIKSGYRMEQPEYASDTIYQIMLNCWKKEAEDRPSFSELYQELADLLEERVKDYYLDLSGDYHDPAVVKEDSDAHEDFKPIAVSNDSYLFMGQSDAPYPAQDLNRRSKKHGGSGDKIEMTPLLANGGSARPGDAKQPAHKIGEILDDAVVDDQGYLLPKEDRKHHLAESEVKDDSIRSNASSGFHSDYLNEYPPPQYNHAQRHLRPYNV